MKNEPCFVSVPYCYMHLDDNENSEVTDMLLYGTGVIPLEDSGKEYVFAKTEYGYCGYVNKNILKKVNKNTEYNKHVVTNGFCNIYPLPEHRIKPLFTLSRGSIITGKIKEIPKSRFSEITSDNGVFYCDRRFIETKENLSIFQDEQSKRKQLVKLAKSYLGTPYLWGGKSSFGIDCSGLCFMVYTMCGLGIYRDAEFDGRYLKKIDYANLKPGDLIYYSGHVVMYIGKNEYIHSSATLGGVHFGSFDSQSPYFYHALKNDIVCCARSLAFY